MYDPDIKPRLSSLTKEQYAKGSGTTINHFYEKLLGLKDRIKTASGRAIAEHRHQVMVDFVKEFEKEIANEC
jgi:uncharacterized protein